MLNVKFSHGYSLEFAWQLVRSLSQWHQHNTNIPTWNKPYPISLGELIEIYHYLSIGNAIHFQYVSFSHRYGSGISLICGFAWQILGHKTSLLAEVVNTHPQKLIKFTSAGIEGGHARIFKNAVTACHRNTSFSTRVLNMLAANIRKGQQTHSLQISSDMALNIGYVGKYSCRVV